MHKQTIILISLLAVVTCILVFLAVTNQNVLKNNQSKVVPTQIVVKKTAKIFFNPTTVNLSATQPTTVDIMIDSGGTPITGVQTELKYDPKSLTGVKINPQADAAGFFGQNSSVLFNENKESTGRLSFAIGIGQNDNPKSGVGKIGTITFTKQPGAVGASTQIDILVQSLVMQLNVQESILKDDIVPLTINFSNGATQLTPRVSTSSAVRVSPAK